MTGHGPRPESAAHAGDGTSEGARPWPEDGDPRFELLVAALAEGPRPVCAGWEEARFQALVHHIARRKLRRGYPAAPMPARAD